MVEEAERPQKDATQIPQWQTRYNPPGLSRLVYRGGRYGRAVDSILKDLLAEPSLARLNTAARHDWTLALVRAWAAATEVLGFYQERIVNEGYLRTATERRSVLELARAIGYELRPGVAASVHLAFTVLTTRDEPARPVDIPAGTAVQSVPSAGEQAQTFETSAEFKARPEWNALRLDPGLASSWPQCSPQKATSARLKGAETGLRPGDALLIVGEAPEQDGAKLWLLATLKTVQAFQELGYTLVTWDKLQVRAGSGPFHSPQAFAMRQQAKLFGYTPASVLCGGGPGTDGAPAAIGLPNAPVHVLVGDDKGILFAGTDLGLFRSADHGATWQPVGVGLVQKKIQALARLDPEGHLLAGTDDGHIYLSKDGGDRWTALTGEQIVLPPRGLAKLWSRGKAPLPKTAIRSLAAYRRGRRRTLAAATDEGVFRSRDRGKTWRPANKDLPNTDPKTGLASGVAWALAVDESRAKADLYAGTDDGVFQIRETPYRRLMVAIGTALVRLGLLPRLYLDQSETGQSEADLSLPGLRKPVHALVAVNGQLFAATETGLYHPNDGSAGSTPQGVGHRLARFLLGDLARQWQRVSDSFASQDIRALYRSREDGDHDAGRYLLAATGDGSVYRWRDHGDTWECLDTSMPLKRIQAVWATQERIYAAGVPSESLVESRWSPFQVEQKVIDLDQEYPNIERGTWVVLRDDRADCTERYQVTEVEVADSRDPAKPGRFSRLTVDRSAGLDSFDRASTLALCQSERVDLLSDQPLEGNKLTFDRHVPGLQRGQRLIVSGRRTRSATAEQDKREPAGDGEEIVSEVVEIADITNQLKCTEVRLKSPLAYLYDRPTVIVYGNVVQATHGQTVERELLGSGEGLAEHQRFLLKQPPLTYTQAATGSGVESTLKIEINRVPWEQVKSFAEPDRDKRVFMLRQDDQGNTAVLFGFGPEDTGIPWGAEQISASYRQGLGSEGNVAAGSLHVLQTAVPGLKDVTNPLAAAGGADPETEAEAQAKAPLSVRTVERIVSLGDYEDFARLFPGIGKAQAQLVSKDYQRWLHITIAGTAGNEVEQDSDVCKKLADKIHRARAFPVPQVVIEFFERVLFCLKATVWIEPHPQDRRAEIEQEAKTALMRAFAFKRRGFGQPVHAAEVITLLQHVPGVFAVRLEQLYTHDQSLAQSQATLPGSGRPGRVSDTGQVSDSNAKQSLSLQAKPARFDEGRLHPAQMLLIDPDGIELDLETTP